MKWREDKRLRQLTLAGLTLVVGAGVAAGLILTRPAPARKERLVIRPMVEVIEVRKQNVPVKITGYGTVQSTVQTQIVPQVEGRVISVHKHLFSGGFIREGEPLVVIDPSDYELALEEAQSLLRQAQASLVSAQTRIAEAQTNLKDATQDLERNHDLYERGVLSRRDADKAEINWRLSQVRVEKEQAELANTQSRLDGTQVAIRRAKLNLERTQITLPLDAVVLSERVDPGQYVSPGQSIGEVYGTAAMEIPVPLEDRQLKWLPTVPMAGRQTSRRSSLPRAEIKVQFAGQTRRWKGTAVRTDGQIDPQSRMVDVVVRVDDSQPKRSEQPPLLPGTFVEVIIHGSTLQDVLPVPHYALHDEDELWLFEKGRLQVKRVQIARREREWIYVSEGIEDGQQIIVTPMDVVTNGMEVRLSSQ